MLTSETAQSLERQLLENREQHFHASTRRKKLAYKKKDKQLRGKLAQALESLGFPADDANKIAEWDPYDQNASAEWFDTEYMFGNRDGFDVAIGNPPYVQLQKDGGKLGHLYKDSGYETFARTGDIYQLFYERGCQLLTPQRGMLAYITSNSWLKAEYGKTTRRYFSEQHTPLRLLEMGKDVFENAIVDTSVLILRGGSGNETGTAVDMDRYEEAIADHDTAIRINPQHATAYYNRGNTKRSLSRNKEAREDFQKCLDLATQQGNEKVAQAAQKALDNLGTA